jgi:hypothetical protein
MLFLYLKEMPLAIMVFFQYLPSGRFNGKQQKFKYPNLLPLLNSYKNGKCQE